jgi:hypothetical protein
MTYQVLNYHIVPHHSILDPIYGLLRATGNLQYLPSLVDTSLELGWSPMMARLTLSPLLRRLAVC